jgi:hypothetical protein
MRGVIDNLAYGKLDNLSADVIFAQRRNSDAAIPPRRRYGCVEAKKRYTCKDYPQRTKSHDGLPPWLTEDELAIARSGDQAPAVAYNKHAANKHTVATAIPAAMASNRR